MWEGLPLVVNPIQFMNTCCKKLSDRNSLLKEYLFMLLFVILAPYQVRAKLQQESRRPSLRRQETIQISWIPAKPVPECLYQGNTRE